MRLLIVNIAFCILSSNVLCQLKEMELYWVKSSDNDTTLFVTIQKNSDGISFVFPYVEGVEYYIYENDSTKTTHRLPGHQSIYGPYKFKLTRKKILFQDKNIRRKFRDLYLLTDSIHSSPDLFSTSTDSYNRHSRLLDLNAVIQIDTIRLPCFKFFQVYYGHNPVYNKYYRILYLDKTSLLPVRIENYYDKDCKYLRSSVCAKKYVKL